MMKQSTCLKKNESKKHKNTKFVMVENSSFELKKIFQRIKRHKKKLENKSKSYLLNQYLYRDARRFFMENQDLKSWHAY